MTCYYKYIMNLGTVVDMLSIYDTYCDLSDLTIGQRDETDFCEMA